jgi:glycerol-3-phosphate acyltransferase PlsY
MLSVLVILFLAYFVGSFPTSIVLGRMLRRIDIREYGSRNAGGTNTMRVLGWKAGLLVMVVDIGKGVLAVLLVSKIRIDPVPADHELVQIIAGLAAVSGHIWTVLARFKGGKGVATAAGVLLALYPWAGIICIAVFFISATTTRYVSVGSITAASLLPLFLMTWNRFSDQHTVSNYFILCSFVVGALICFTHRDNIRRLWNGTENRFTENPFKRNHSS